ncbi:MAG: DUF4321 domain-containing protein [Ruminococcaceae bacterium]|nr:DUF4321 domain-containing protein [Oscillospiraceae bacterium]
MRKHFWLNFFLICVGIVIGSMVADLTAGVSGLSWLSYGLDFGLTSPFVLDMSVFHLTLGISVKITISSVIFVAISLVLGRLIVKK